MKKILVLLLTFLVFNTASRAQYVNVPDDNLRAYMMQNFPTCFNASNMLDTTCTGIVNVNSLIVNFYSPGGVTTLNWDGFQYFKNLQDVDFEISMSSTNLPDLPSTLRKLVVGTSSITALPALPNNLKYLMVSNLLSLTALPALPNSMEFLDCSYSGLLSLPVLPSSLKYLNCSWAHVASLPALPGLLDTLICSYAGLTSMPALPASLTYLDCNSNAISTAIPALPAGIKYLNCGYNAIPALPSIPAGLQYLSAEFNEINSIPALPASLKTLNVGYDPVASLPALPAILENLEIGQTLINSLPPVLPVGLKTLGFRGDHVNYLPALPAALEMLECSSNLLTTIPPLPTTLTWLSCGSNLLSGLPLLPAYIYSLTCDGNQLTSLPPLPHNLTYLTCANNHLYYLPALPDTLYWLNCSYNNLTCLPVLPSTINSPIGLQIIMDNNITCIPNQPFNLMLTLIDTATQQSSYPNNFPLCSAINNIHHCDAFPLMTGYAYNDNNNNLVKDANEPYRANIKVQLSNGAFTMTNSNGYYQIPADSIGNYSVTATAPNFFAAVPAQYNYNFNSYDTLITNDFALQATSTVDSLTISVLPINWAARPGFPFPYLISYQNVGSTTLPANIVFNYDNTRLIYDSSSNAAVLNSGSALTLAEPGFVAGEQKAFVGYFRVNPAAVIGDSIRAYASIHANAITVVDSTISGIRGAYDPNDKSATPKLTPSQVANGNYIYYTIRFQNTGNDTAFSVVITDTLNSQLQANSLEVINTSHPAKITVKGNVVYFEFINILLPDSNVNEMKSHGYVSFRIKPQPTVLLNSTIPNKAAIYFDYNSPVITNTAITTISNAQTVPLKLISFKVIRSIANNANAYWNTSDEINVQSYNIEMSVDGRNFNNIASEKAKGYQYNDYTKTISIPNNDILYFRSKMTDVDGRYTYSHIVTLRNDISNSFSVLNNPVKNELNISIPDEALKNTTAKIYNSQGLLVKTVLLQHDIETINVRSLPAGIYYLVTEKGSSQFIVAR